MNDRTLENNGDSASKDASNSDGAHKGDSLPKNDPNGDPSLKDASDAETPPKENLGLKDGDRLEAQNDSNVHCQNDAMKWSGVECFVLYISKNPWKFCWGLLAVINLVYFGEILWNPLPSAFQEVLDSRTDLTASIFDAQVTFVGLIFPIVLSFIGLLINDKLAHKIIWKIYQAYSCYKLVGYSGLFLIAVYLVFSAFEPLFIDRFKLLVVDSIILWFVANILLSAWFLTSTVNFVLSDFRVSTLLKYIQNNILPYETSTTGTLSPSSELSSINVAMLILEQIKDAIKQDNEFLYQENLKILKRIIKLIQSTDQEDLWEKLSLLLMNECYRMGQSLFQKNPVNPLMVREWILLFPELFSEEKTTSITKLHLYLKHYLFCGQQLQKYKAWRISLNQNDQNDLTELDAYFNGAWIVWKCFIAKRKDCKQFKSYRRELILHSLLALYDAFQFNDLSYINVAFTNVNCVINNYPQTRKPSTGNPQGELESESEFIFVCFGLLFLHLESKINGDKRNLLKSMVNDIRLRTQTKDNIDAILAMYLRACVRWDNDPNLFEQQVAYFDDQLKFRKINILGIKTTYEPLINTRVSTVCKLLLLGEPVCGIKNACLKCVESLDKEKLQQYLLNLRNICIEPELADRCLGMNKNAFDKASSSINQAIDDALQNMKN